MFFVVIDPLNEKKMHGHMECSLENYLTATKQKKKNIFS
jgi:hypothetical protein